jgi:hypothetical protein
MTPERMAIPRPWCCPEPRCAPVHQLSDNPDLSVPSPGDSFSCWGSLAETVRFVYDGVDHANDLRSCHYTPLKGLVMWQENRDDWRLLRDAYDRALTTVDPTPTNLALVTRTVLEALAQRDGVSLESDVEPGQPARNYELADRLGIGHIFGIGADSGSGKKGLTASLDPGQGTPMR